MRTFEHRITKQRQQLAVADLLHDGVDEVREAVNGREVFAVYSDPPWSPGNEKWWRRHAGVNPPTAYDELLDAWCGVVVDCVPQHVFCEQSSNDKHRQMFMDVVARIGWELPLLEMWTVVYGSPGPVGCRRPNKLLHFGRDALKTDPSGIRSVAMTRRVFEGVDWPAKAIVVDPCMGKGMTSRLAHEFGLDCIGTELNSKRLEYTIAWLIKKGYEEVCGER